MNFSDGDMTDPHMSMVRGMNMWSADHMTEYLSVTNIEVAKWQKAYPYGVAIGNNRTDIWFMDDDIDEYGQSLDWGGCYFFFGRVMITNHFKVRRKRQMFIASRFVHRCISALRALLTHSLLNSFLLVDSFSFFTLCCHSRRGI